MGLKFKELSSAIKFLWLGHDTNKQSWGKTDMVSGLRH